MSVYRSKRDYKFELIRSFDRITFNLDLIKSIIKWRPDMDYHELMDAFRRYGKPYGMHRWKYLPNEGEQYQISNIRQRENGDLFVIGYSLEKDYGLTSCAWDASLIQRIFWYDGGNGKMINIKGVPQGWEESKLEAIFFLSPIFNSKLFKEWNHLYYTLYTNYNEETNQILILPYTKEDIEKKKYEDNSSTLTK